MLGPQPPSWVPQLAKAPSAPAASLELAAAPLACSLCCSPGVPRPAPPCGALPGHAGAGGAASAARGDNRPCPALSRASASPCPASAWMGTAAAAPWRLLPDVLEASTLSSACASTQAVSSSAQVAPAVRSRQMHGTQVAGVRACLCIHVCVLLSYQKRSWGWIWCAHPLLWPLPVWASNLAATPKCKAHANALDTLTQLTQLTHPHAPSHAPGATVPLSGLTLSQAGRGAWLLKVLGTK